MSDAETLSVRIRADAGDFQRGMQQASAALAGFGRQTSALSAGLAAGAGFAAFNLALSGMARALGAVQSATIGFNASLEQSQVAFTTLLKSGERAQAFLFDLQRFAVATPFELKDVVTGARNLLGMGFAAKDVKGILEDLGNAAAALGLSSSDVQRLALVFGQMHTAGRVLGQDLLQLSSAGINVGDVFAIMAQQTGKTVPELKAMQEAGTLSADAFITAFRTLSQQQFAGAMAAQARTFTGAMSTIKDSLQVVASTAFKPLFDRISALAQRIAEFVQSDQFTVWSARVAAGVDVALTALGTLADAFGSALSAVFQVALAWGQAIYEALSWINPWARHSPSLVDQVSTGVDAIVAQYAGLRGIAAPIAQAQEAIKELGTTATGEALTKGLKDMAAAAKDRVDDISAALRDAREDLQRFTRAPVEGSKAFADALFGTSQEIAQRQLLINKVQRAQFNRQPVSAEDRRNARNAGREITGLQLEQEGTRLQEQITLGPQRKAIEDLTKPAELPFGVIVAGIKGAQGAIATLEPALTRAQAYFDVLRDAADKAGKAVAVALTGGGGDKLGGIDEALADAKAQLDAWKKSMDTFKADFQNSPLIAFLNDAGTAMQGFSSVLTTNVAPAIEGVRDPIQKLGTWIKDVWTNAMNYGFVDSLATAIDRIKSILGALGGYFTQFVTDITGLGSDTGAKAAQNAKETGQGLAAIASALSEILGVLNTFLKAGGDIAKFLDFLAFMFRFDAQAARGGANKPGLIQQLDAGSIGGTTAADVRGGAGPIRIDPATGAQIGADGRPVTIGGRANGGPVTGGELYRVNESGEEYFRPAVSGVVIPAGRLDADLVGGSAQTVAQAAVAPAGSGRWTDHPERHDVSGRVRVEVTHDDQWAYDVGNQVTQRLIESRRAAKSRRAYQVPGVRG